MTSDIWESPMEAKIYLLCLENRELRVRRLIPSYQVKIGKYRADFLFPQIKAVLEYDGRGFHDDVLRDVERDIYFQKQGYSTYRISKPNHFFILDKNGETIVFAPKLEVIIAYFALEFKDYWPEQTSGYTIRYE